MHINIEHTGTGSIQNTGTGKIEHTGTGSIEHTGTGSIEHTGTGAIEHTGSGSVEQTGTGKVSRVLTILAAFSLAFASSVIADTASYKTDYGFLDIHTKGKEVRVSWHFNDGQTKQFLVGSGVLEAEYSNITLHDLSLEKIGSDGTGSGKIGSDGTGSDKIGSDGTGSDKIASDGTGSGKIASDGTGSQKSVRIWGELDMVFTNTGIEFVASRMNLKGEVETIVFDLDNRTDYSQAIVFIENDF